MAQTSVELEVVLANTFMMYYRAHAFHWNVTGILFHSIHQYFDNLYNQLWNQIDPIAEQIRALGPLAPATLNDLVSRQSALPDNQGTPGTPAEMISELLDYNQVLINSLNVARQAAEDEGHFGLVNFLEDLLDKHAKIGWQLKAHLI
jgi:starvation-inducible DNA-binding protein